MSSPVTTNLSNLPAVTGGTSTKVAKNTLDKDSFLTLLTTQLQHQDPLAPMDSNAFVAQLAQFSSVEALENMGRKLDTLALGQANANQMAVPQLIGKQVVYKSSTLGLTSGATATFSVALDAPSTGTTVLVADGAGRIVRTLDLGPRDAGTSSVTWDGLDQTGNALPSGQYFLTVAAAAKDGSAIGASTAVRGTVTGVSFDHSVPQLIVNGVSVNLSDVSQIASPPPAP
jgi:flagellar basal-body rod modification protein FlgD